MALAGKTANSHIGVASVESRIHRSNAMLHKHRQEKGTMGRSPIKVGVAQGVESLRK